MIMRRAALLMPEHMAVESFMLLRADMWQLCICFLTMATEHKGCSTPRCRTN